MRGLLAHVALCFPTANGLLLADRGLRCLERMRLCPQMPWHDVLRMSQGHLLRRQFKRGDHAWHVAGPMVRREGLEWYGNKEHHVAASLVAWWEPEKEDTWIVMPDVLSARKPITMERWRMHVEATFQDRTSRR